MIGTYHYIALAMFLVFVVLDLAVHARRFPEVPLWKAKGVLFTLLYFAVATYAPLHPLTAVVCTPAAFAGLSPEERLHAIEVLQSATRDGGVHLVETIVAGQVALSVDELAERYAGWEVSVENGLGASPTFVARKVKLPVYAREGVRHVWLLDPKPRTLEVYRLEGTSYVLLATSLVLTLPPLGVVWLAPRDDAGA